MKSYRFVDGEYEIKYEIKKSIFIATVIGEVDDLSAETFVKSIKKKYSDATHNCYGYISDINMNATRFSDDGEPSGTAGGPILEVIKKQGLSKSAVVVTRYFGGIKLGAGGLVSAYTEAASQALKSAKISEKFESKKISVQVDYSTWATLEKNLRKQDCQIDSVNFDNNVSAFIYSKVDNEDKILKLINEISQGKCDVKVLDGIEYIKY